MSLTKQVHLYSVATDAFYTDEEQYLHNQMLKLYKLRKKADECKWRKAMINRVIAKKKEKMIELLNLHLEKKETRKINDDALKDKAIVSLFESSLTRALNLETNSLTDKILIVNVFFFQVFEDIVKYGFEHHGDKYVFLTASAGQIRTKRAVFIRKKDYIAIRPKLMCGLSIEDINKQGGINPNKFLAYLALNNSATDVWEDFNIDKAIVVEDFETEVEGKNDHIDDVTYEIKREWSKTLIPHTDGCGMMLHGKTRMLRAPFIKGLIVQFPFDRFIREKCVNGKAIVKDIYGTKHDILEEGIEYILFKSQFKLWKYFKNWNEYKQKFKENHCEVSYCNIEEDYIPKGRINYQMLQTLSDMSNEEIKRLTKATIKEINNIGNDFSTTMRLLGATLYNQNPSWFQQALMIYPELFRDNYCRDILRQTKKSLVKQAKAGRLRINGYYTFVVPDFYAVCEYLFLGVDNPNGLLKEKEVYTTLFRDEDELACLRSPHLYREWPIMINKRNEELDKWFGETKCIYTSCKALTSKMLQFD